MGTVVINEKVHLAEAVIDLAAIAENIRTVAAIARTGLMAVVKADGFGHGVLPVARAALGAGAAWLGVTSATEAVALRSAGIDAPVLSWLHRPDEDYTRLIAADVDIAVSTLTHLRAIVTAATDLGGHRPRGMGVPGTPRARAPPPSSTPCAATTCRPAPERICWVCPAAADPDVR